APQQPTAPSPRSPPRPAGRKELASSRNRLPNGGRRTAADGRRGGGALQQATGGGPGGLGGVGRRWRGGGGRVEAFPAPSRRDGARRGRGDHGTAVGGGRAAWPRRAAPRPRRLVRRRGGAGRQGAGGAGAVDGGGPRLGQDLRGARPAARGHELEAARNGWRVAVEPIGLAKDASYGRFDLGGEPLLVEFYVPGGWIVSRPNFDYNGSAGTVQANDYGKGDSATLWVDTKPKVPLAEMKKKDYLRELKKRAPPGWPSGLPAGMSTHSLRQLGIGSLKRVYKLDPPALVKALQDAAARRIVDRQLWDALLYRAALLRSEMKPMDLALVADALGKSRHRDVGFMEHLLEEVRTKTRRFLVYDVALLTNAFAKLTIRDELLSRSLLPPLLRRIRDQTRADNLALLALAYARLNDSSREPVFDRVVAVLTPRVNSIRDGHTLSTLLCAFTLPAQHDQEATAGSMFRLEGLSQGPEDDGAPDSVEDEEPGGLPHLPFVEALLAQCDQSLFSFRSNDLLHLCLALASLARQGRADLVQPRLLRRVAKRAELVHHEFMPAQSVRLLEMLCHLPELEAQCAPRLLDEVAYRIRSATAQSCLATLKVVQRLGGHARAHSAACWRLCSPEAAAMLSAEEVCEAAEVLAALRPHPWEAREALLGLLQSMSQRQLQPEAGQLCRMLRAFGEAGVRDTHWFHVCQKLCVEDLSTASEATAPPARPPEDEPLGEQALADAALALARLNLPRLADAALIFERAAAAVRSARAAATALEVRAPGGGPCLFPFAGDAAAVGQPDAVAAWQAALAAPCGGPGADADDFELAVGRELSTWAGVSPSRPVQVGPVRVPFALSLVELAEHLQSRPLDGPAEDGGAWSAWP
ncbi:unnamed protein product, partial [Prorocentrum cordatum]